MTTYDLEHRDTNIYIHKDLDQLLREQRDFTLNDDQDSLILLDGNEGSGKSQTARQIGYVLSKHAGTPFGVENIHQTAEDYIRFAAQAQRGSVVILDEGRDVLNRRRSMSTSNTEFTNYTSRNRADNLFQIICLPSYHDIDSNIAKHRAKFLIHCFKSFPDTEDETYESGVRCVPGHYAVYDQGQSLRYHHEKGNYTYPEQYDIRSDMNDAEPLTDEDLQVYEEEKQDVIESKYLQSVEDWKDDFLEYIENAPDALNSVKAVCEWVRESRNTSQCFRDKESLTYGKSTFRQHLQNVSEKLEVSSE